MKQLLLMRHAKSSWDSKTLKDIDRPLNEQGIFGTHMMAKQIGLLGFKPQIIFCSVANRTSETARLLCQKLSWHESLISFEHDLYTFEENEVLDFLKNVTDTYKGIMIVGHNPAFTYLFNSLSGDLIPNLPTAGAALLEFQFDNWKDIGKTHGTTLWKGFPSMFS